MLLDLDNPGKVLHKNPKILFWPEYDFEISGFLSNIIFPTGTVMRGDDLLLYYGAGDSTCAWRITSHAATKVGSSSRMYRFRVKFRLSAWLSAVSMVNLAALFPSSGLGMRKRW